MNLNWFKRGKYFCLIYDSYTEQNTNLIKWFEYQPISTILAKHITTKILFHTEKLDANVYELLTESQKRNMLSVIFNELKQGKL